MSPVIVPLICGSIASSNQLIWTDPSVAWSNIVAGSVTSVVVGSGWELPYDSRQAVAQQYLANSLGGYVRSQGQGAFENLGLQNVDRTALEAAQLALEEAQIGLAMATGAPFQPPAAPDNAQEAAPFRDVIMAAAREAADKSHNTLLAHLDADQATVFTRTRTFTVIVRERRYRIDTRRMAGNIMLLNEKGEDAVKLCAHTSNVPPYDNALAQKLLLEADEDLLLATANATAVGIISPKEFAFWQAARERVAARLAA
jgi:hypothetical protein